MMHSLKFLDVSNQYKTITNDIKNNVIQSIYSKFNFSLFTYYQYNQNNDYDINKMIENFLFNSLKNYKFITYNYSHITNNDSNIFDITICVEDQCFIIEKIYLEIIERIINKLKNEKISILNVGKHFGNITKTKTEFAATDEVDLFCSNLYKYIRDYPIIKLTIKSIAGFLIRRYYYPSKYFKHITFNQNLIQSNESKIKEDLYNFLFYVNQYDVNEDDDQMFHIIYEFKNRIESNEKNYNEKNDVYFKENDFIKVKTFSTTNENFTFAVCIHTKNLNLFMVKIITEKGKMSKQTEREIEFCKNYSNRCFTKFHGMVINENNEEIGLAFEYMTNDSLYSYLKNLEGKKIDNKFFIIILLRICQSIEYLHKNSFIYRDLKPDNILIDHDFNPYITDYESVRHPPNEDEEITNDLGSDFYTSPEQYKGKNISFPTDIYSFGVLMKYLINKTDIKNVSNDLIKLYESCIVDNPYKRPNIWQIKQVLMNEFNSFSIFEQILIDETKEKDKNEIIQFIYEIILLVIQKQDIHLQTICIQNIFCFRRLLLLIINNVDNSMLNFYYGQLYQHGYGSAIKQDLFKAEKYYKLAAHQNNPLAQHNLGYLYFQGFGGENNYKKAKEYFESAAKQNIPSSINYLGYIYEKGCGVQINYNMAKKYYEIAAKMKEPYALNNLGNLYEHGLGVVKNYSTARYLYEQSAKLMNSGAFYNLGRLYFKGLGVQKDYLHAKSYFEQAAELNDPDSFNALGMMYSDGYGVQKDYIRAKNYYEKAAKFNDPDALFELGLFYEKGYGVEQNYIKAREFYELSAKYENSDALYKLGLFYEKGYCVEQNYIKAREFYELSAKYKNSDALYQLGFYYEKGYGVEKNYIKAKKFYELSANYENSSALLRLGILYYNGILADQNFTNAKMYFELSARQNDINALFYLGNIYRRGLGVEKNYAEARKLYELAAIHNHSDSLLNLGVLYEEGLGVNINHEIAKKYFESSAKLKNSKASLNLGIVYLDVDQDYSKAFHHLKIAAQQEPEAMCILGLMYMFAKGVKQDYEKARYYFELSSKSNNSESMYYLGLMYYSGLGVKKDLNMAIKFFKSSANLGEFRALNGLGMLFSNEKGIPLDYGKAIYYFEQLANQNNPIGYNNLGYLYAFCPGIKHNYNKAIEYFKLAANLKYYEAYFHLGNLYYDGIGVEQDYQKARKYFEIASKQNNSYAYYNLGKIFLKGYGVEKNYKVSRKYFELSAQLNNPSALFILGNIYSSSENEDFDIKKAIICFNKCIDLIDDKLILNNQEYGLEVYYTRNNKYRRRAMNDLGLIYLIVFQDDEKAKEYIKNSAFGEYPFGQNNYGLLNQLYIKDIQEAVHFYTKSSKNNFALAYYNLGFLKETENKIDEAISFYIKASENENEPLLFQNMIHCDKRLKISKTFIICLTNLKLVDYYLSIDDLNNAKKYFIKSFSKLNLRSYQFKFKFSNENKFSYLKYFILNYPSFNLKNQINLPSDLDLNIFKQFNNNQINENKDNEINKDLRHKEIKMKQKLDKSENGSQQLNNDEKKYENVDDLFSFATSEKSFKNDFISEIKEIIQTMSKILYTPPYSILFGRIITSVIKKKDKFPYKKNVSPLFYEGFGIQMH